MATVHLHNESIDQGINGEEQKHFCCELIKHLSVSLKQTQQKRLVNFVEPPYGNWWQIAPLSQCRKPEPTSLIKRWDAQMVNPITHRPCHTAQGLASWWLWCMHCLTASGRTTCTAEKPRQRMRIWKGRQARETTNHPNMQQWRKRKTLASVYCNAAFCSASSEMTVKDEEQLLAFEGGTVLIVGVARCKAVMLLLFCFLFIGIYCGINHTETHNKMRKSWSPSHCLSTILNSFEIKRF